MAGFFDMGGYGDFVWGAYGLTAVVLTVLAVASVRRLKTLERDLAAHESETTP